MPLSDDPIRDHATVIFLRTRIDAAPRRTGQWFLTGSHEAGLMRNITESMAGHAIEVNPRGETVWRYSNPEVTPKGLRNGIIRMTRVDPSTLTFLPADPMMEEASER